MSLNGCHNRPPLSDKLYVQIGWSYDLGSRMAQMAHIADPMTKECQYSILHKNDPKCDGCRWRNNTTGD